MNELEMILAGALVLLAVCGLRLYQSGAGTQRSLMRRSLELQAVVNALRRCEQRFDQRCEELESELAILTQEIQLIDRDLHAEPVRIEEAVSLAMDGVHAQTLVSNGFSVAEAELAVSLYGHASKPAQAPARAAVAQAADSKPAHSAAAQPAVTAQRAADDAVGRAVAKPTKHRAKDWMGEAQFRTLADKIRAAARSQSAPFGTVSDRELEEDRISLSAAGIAEHSPRNAGAAPRAGRRVRRAVASR